MVSELHAATLLRRLDRLQQLLDQGQDPNQSSSDAFKTTPLHLAARSGSVSAAKALLCAKANPNAADNQGWTPIFEAVKKVHPHVLQTLLDAGAKIDVTDKWERLPLHYLLCDQHGGTPEEKQIRLLLTGNRDTSFSQKQVLLARAAHNTKLAREAAHFAAASSKALETVEAMAAAQARERNLRREAELRRLCQPHAWVSNCQNPDGASTPPVVNTTVPEVEAIAALSDFKAQQKDRLDKEAAWRRRFQTLGEGALPECDPPGNIARWNKSQYCWEYPAPERIEDLGIIRTASDFYAGAHCD